MKAHIDQLQDQVNTLFSNISDLHQKVGLQQLEGSQISSGVSLPSQPQGVETRDVPRARQRSKHPRFHGPTSSEFNFGVAKSSLQTMGIAADGDTEGIFATHSATPAGSPPTQPTTMPKLLAHPDKDPLWLITREEAIRLCRVYEEEIGIMYPLIDLEKLISQTNLLFNFLEATDRTGLAQRFGPGADELSDDDTNILKMVFAITLSVEGAGQSTLGTKLVNSVKAGVDANVWDNVGIKAICCFALVVSGDLCRLV